GGTDALAARRSGPGATPEKQKMRAAAAELEMLALNAPEKDVKAEALLEAGNARALAGDTLAATEDWQRAVESGEGWPKAEAWLAAARAYSDLGQPDRSQATFLAMISAFADLPVPADRRAEVE